MHQLAHADMLKGYIHAVVAQGAPKRQGKLISAPMKNHLGDSCRVAKNSRGKVDVLVGFVNTCTFAM